MARGRRRHGGERAEGQRAGVVVVRDQGLGETEVEVHRPEAGAGGPDGVGQGSQCRLGVLGGVGVREVEAGRHGGAEEIGLQLAGLVRPCAAQLARPVCCDHDEGAAAVVCLQHRGVQVGGGRAGRRHDRPGRAQRGERRDPLVVADVEVEVVRRGLQRIGEGGAAGTGTHHDVPHPGEPQRLDGQPGEQRRGIHPVMLAVAAGRRRREARVSYSGRRGQRDLRRLGLACRPRLRPHRHHLPPLHAVRARSAARSGSRSTGRRCATPSGRTPSTSSTACSTTPG